MFIFISLISLQFFNFALEYAISKVQEYQTELKLNGTNQVLVHAGLEVNTEKTKCMLLFHHQNAGQNNGIKRTDPLKTWHSSNIWELQ
jgi:hypothetical protein